MKTTISLIKCDVGSLGGHHVVPEPLTNIAKKNLKKAEEEGLINSYYVFHAGDDLELLMVHNRGESNSDIHELAWDTFKEAADKALELKLYGAGQYMCHSKGTLRILEAKRSIRSPGDYQK